MRADCAAQQQMIDTTQHAALLHPTSTSEVAVRSSYSRGGIAIYTSSAYCSQYIARLQYSNIFQYIEAPRRSAFLSTAG